jgi:uncharacterized damage-inducible protein DinB
MILTKARTIEDARGARMIVTSPLNLVRHSVERSMEGDAWHGPSLARLLADITPGEAQSHPIAGAHSILELVLHISSWVSEVASRLRGNPPGDPASGDWPEVGLDPAEAWQRANAELWDARGRLRSALAEFPEMRLGDLVGPTREAQLGTGMSFGATLIGLAEHNAYHGGQIAILKRAVRTERERAEPLLAG